MGLFKKKADPISDRARSLNAEIAALEAQIKKLDAQLQQPTSQFRTGSNAASDGLRRNPANLAPHKTHVPVFEANDFQGRKAPLDGVATAQHFNDLGVRKYDLAAAFRRFRAYFRGPDAHNPKLVSYLAAGSIKGLRPLRYEKRVARNRFIALFIVLLILSWGIAAALLR